MRSKLDSCENGCRTISSTDDTERCSFFDVECSRAYSHEKNCEDSKLCSRAKDRKAKVSQHWSEISESSNTHEDNWWQESCLDEHIVEEVHQSKVVGYCRERHIPNILTYQFAFRVEDASSLVCLIYAHVATRKISYEHAESYRNEEKWLKMFYYAKVQKHEGKKIHDEVLTI